MNCPEIQYKKLAPPHPVGWGVEGLGVNISKEISWTAEKIDSFLTRHPHPPGRGGG